MALDMFQCNIPNVGPKPMAASCILVFAGGAAALYFWHRMHAATLKNQMATAVEERKSRVRMQKESMCMTLASPPTGEVCQDVVPAYGQCQDVDKMRSRIVNLTVDQLLQEVAEGRFTVLQVLQAYRAEAFRVDLRTNCITEYLEEAEELAKYLDTMDVKGPLHGLPISVTETYNIKCHDCTAGLAKYLGKPCTKDAVLIMAMKKLGAVPFARTNVVQTSCSFGNSNPIYGETSNPHCPDRIPGGSACGEGALLGLGGSLVGLGADVGGSLRIPAAMCGIFTIKPTHHRFSGVGIRRTIDGLTGLHDVPGIMSREVQALITVFRALVSPTMFQLDPRVVPLPFQKEMFNVQRPLKIGYYEDDGRICPTPGCRRAVRVAKCILEKMGHEVVPFTVPAVNKAFELAMSLFAADGGRSIDEMLENEPQISKSMSYMKKSFFQKTKEAVSGRKQIRPMKCGLAVTEKSTYELWKLLAEREEYVELFIQTWKCQNLDAVLAPGFALPAFTSNFIIPLGDTIFITMLYNMLNFPVGAVPVTRETEEDQRALEQYQAEEALQRCMKKATMGANGMPLGVQIVGLPWQEELVLRLMKDIELGLKSQCVDEEAPPSPCYTVPMAGTGPPCGGPPPCPSPCNINPCQVGGQVPPCLSPCNVNVGSGSPIGSQHMTGSQMAGSQMPGSQMPGSQMAGSQMAGSQMGSTHGSHMSGRPPCSQQMGGSQMGGSQMGPGSQMGTGGSGMEHVSRQGTMAPMGGSQQMTMAHASQQMGSRAQTRAPSGMGGGSCIPMGQQSSQQKYPGSMKY